LVIHPLLRQLKRVRLRSIIGAKGVKSAFCPLLELPRSSELFGQAVSLRPPSFSSAGRPNSQMTFSPTPLPCRFLHACARPGAGSDRSPPSAPRSPRPAFAVLIHLALCRTLAPSPLQSLRSLAQRLAAIPASHCHSGLVPELFSDPFYKRLAPQNRPLIRTAVKVLDLLLDLATHEFPVFLESTEP
jgi:hypothetical protein